MAARKGRAQDLNAPLRALAQRLRDLQKEAGDALENVRRESRRRAPARQRAESTSLATENPLMRAASNLIERWDAPSRAELAAVVERLERVERALAAHQILESAADSAPPATPPKPRRRRRTPRND